MTIDPNRLQYLDKECDRLSHLFESIPLNKLFKGGIKALIDPSTKTQIPMDEPFLLRQGDSIWWCESGFRIGFSKTDEIAFRKLVDTIYNDQEVNTYISKEFLTTNAFQSLVDSRDAKETSAIFSKVLLHKMENSIQSYNVFLKLIGFNVKQKFKIGEVEIGRFTTQFFNKHIAAFKFVPKTEHEPEIDIEEYRKQGLDAVSKLLQKLPVEKKQTELQRLVVRSLRRFASALSEHNLHRRIADLFTVLESLLLIDQNAPIMDSVTKYLSKLIYKDLEERKQCIALVKKMYAVRSMYLHHAKEESFETGELAHLQVNVLLLVVKMITKSIDYETKAELFKEIDDAIIAAYTPKIFRHK